MLLLRNSPVSTKPLAEVLLILLLKMKRENFEDLNSLSIVHFFKHLYSAFPTYIAKYKGGHHKSSDLILIQEFESGLNFNNNFSKGWMLSLT